MSWIEASILPRIGAHGCEDTNPRTKANRTWSSSAFAHGPALTCQSSCADHQAQFLHRLPDRRIGPRVAACNESVANGGRVSLETVFPGITFHQPITFALDGRKLVSHRLSG